MGSIGSLKNRCTDAPVLTPVLQEFCEQHPAVLPDVELDDAIDEPDESYIDVEVVASCTDTAGAQNDARVGAHAAQHPFCDHKPLLDSWVFEGRSQINNRIWFINRVR